MPRNLQRRQARDKAVTDYFYDLYDKKRVRYDDCLLRTAEKFYISVHTVKGIIYGWKCCQPRGVHAVVATSESLFPEAL